MPHAELPLPVGLKTNEGWVSIDAGVAPASIDGVSTEFAAPMHDEVLGCWKARASESELQSFYEVPNIIAKIKAARAIPLQSKPT